MAQVVFGHFHPAVGGKIALLPRQRRMAHRIGGAHRRNHVDKVKRQLHPPFVFTLKHGQPAPRVDGGEYTVVMHIHPALGKQHARFFRHNRHAEQAVVVGIVGELGLAQITAAKQMVAHQKSVFQRRTRAFHLRGRAQKHRLAAAVGKTVEQLPGFKRALRAVVDAADAVLADQRLIHAFDGSIIQLQTGGDKQKIISDFLATRCGDAVALRIELGHMLAQPFHVGGQIIRRFRHCISRRFHP